MSAVSSAFRAYESVHSEGCGWFAPSEVYSGVGADIVMESITLPRLDSRFMVSSWPSPKRVSITAVTFSLRCLLLNCRQPGACLLVRQMQIARCGRAFARRLRRVSHNDRDWLDVYRAAVMEFDRDKLPASIEI